MSRRLIVILSLLIAVILLMMSASAVGARSESNGRKRQLTTKQVLTSDDIAYLKSLPREDRREILTARGWREIVIPDQYQSYRDLIPVEELRVAYEQVLKNWRSEFPVNEALDQSGKGVSSFEETLRAIERNCMEMEKYIPFDQFKVEERWIPSARDLQRNHDVIGGWGTSRGDGNTCDFEPAENGDIVLVKGSGLFPGIFCHAAIVTYEFSSAAFSLGADKERGVCWNSRKELNEYSHASVQRVDTRPLSSSRRQTAANWAGRQLGKPYNSIFVNKWRTDALYCSQLCWAAYYHTSPWYCVIDLDGIPDTHDFGAVSPDALWLSWRTSTVTCSD